MTLALVDHIWQSTLFVVLVWLAAMALRSNGARVRVWMWTAASIKFLVPLSLLVNVGDQTFSSSAGSDCCIGPTPVVSMPYAHASSCVDWIADGRGNVDLTGTPFVVDDVFTIRGWFSAGSANSGTIFVPWDGFQSIAVQGAVVNLTGGGVCGGIGPTINGGAFNAFAGFDLQLAYTGGVSLDKESCKNGGWEAFGVFKNQGDCVSWFATGGRNAPGR